MVDTFSHGAMLAVPAALTSAVCEYVYGYPLVEPLWLLTLVIGSIFPDIVGEPWLWYGRHKRFGKRRGWWRVWWYDDEMTKELEVLHEEHLLIFVPYKLFHSVWGAFALTWCAYFLFGWWLALAFGAGYFIHIAVDVATHKLSWPLWPLLGTPTTFAERDWWTTGLYCHCVSVAGFEVRTAYAFVIPVACVGIAHLYSLFPPLS